MDVRPGTVTCDFVATLCWVSMNAARLIPVTDSTMISTASSRVSDGSRVRIDVVSACAGKRSPLPGTAVTG